MIAHPSSLAKIMIGDAGTRDAEFPRHGPGYCAQMERQPVANVFVLGLNDFNLETLEATAALADCRFHGVLGIEEIQYQEEIRLPELLDRAARRIDAFEGGVDAIVGYWDFPVTSMVPLLCRRYGLRSSGLESVVRCEHKYLCRLEQQKVIEEYPGFALVDPDDPRPPSDLSYPMWLKPVKSFGSELAIRVTEPSEFAPAVARIAARIDRIGAPFEDVMSQVDLPPEIDAAGGRAILAEEEASGAQVTVEGYIADGEVVIYGAVDSIPYPHSASFLRWQYPSSLPEPVLKRMGDVAGRITTHLGLDSTCFNVEFFWDAERDLIRLLEVNPRPSQGHARVFELVDGTPNLQALVRLALGRPPELRHRQGPYDIAAKWFLRRFRDGVVERAPGPDDVARIEEEVPGTTVRIVVGPGSRLSEMYGQDAYSFQLAQVFVGAGDEAEMAEKYERCVKALRFEISE